MKCLVVTATVALLAFALDFVQSQISGIPTTTTIATTDQIEIVASPETSASTIKEELFEVYINQPADFKVQNNTAQSHNGIGKVDISIQFSENFKESSLLNYSAEMTQTTDSNINNRTVYRISPDDVVNNPLQVKVVDEFDVFDVPFNDEVVMYFNASVVGWKCISTQDVTSDKVTYAIVTIHVKAVQGKGQAIISATCNMLDNGPTTLIDHFEYSTVAVQTNHTETNLTTEVNLRTSILWKAYTGDAKPPRPPTKSYINDVEMSSQRNLTDPTAPNSEQDEENPTDVYEDPDSCLPEDKPNYIDILPPSLSPQIKVQTRPKKDPWKENQPRNKDTTLPENIYQNSFPEDTYQNMLSVHKYKQ